MASAGVHRAMSERAGRSDADAPAPFGVTVQSPLDFTPTTAMPVVPPMSVETDTITVATSVPGGLPRRVRAVDLPPASAVRPVRLSTTRPGERPSRPGAEPGAAALDQMGQPANPRRSMTVLQLPPTLRDLLALAARLLLGVVLLAHG